jgi:hypothetical protein
LVSLTLSEEHRFRVFENRVLGRIFGNKRKDGEDCIMRSFITCTRQQILLASVACMLEIRNAYKILVGKSEGITQKT